MQRGLNVKLRDLLHWFSVKPATKVAWLALILTLITNILVTWQNSTALNSANRMVLLTMEPTVEVIFTSDTAYVLNTTSENILDVRIHPIVYRIEQDPFRILDRHGGGSYPIAASLAPRDTVPILMFHLVDDRAPRVTSDPNVIRVALITFRRQIDFKKFADIEIFYAVPIEGKTTLFPILSGKNTTTGGAPYFYLQVVDEIVRIEKSFFKVEHFQ